jgi:hypothetical protein
MWDDGSLLAGLPVMTMRLARLHAEMAWIPTHLESGIRVLEWTENPLSTVHTRG